MMNRTISCLLVAWSATWLALPAVAADVEAGRQKAAACISCHGVNGISRNPLYPNLAGQKAGYLARQLLAFRDGDRNDPMMSSIVRTLGDDDIGNLAAWYSSLDASGGNAPCGE